MLGVYAYEENGIANEAIVFKWVVDFLGTNMQQMVHGVSVCLLQFIHLNLKHLVRLKL